MRQSMAVTVSFILLSCALTSGSWAKPRPYVQQHQVHSNFAVSQERADHKNLPSWENDIWEVRYGAISCSSRTKFPQTTRVVL